MRYTNLLGLTAGFLLAATVFTGLMACIPLGREQAAWAVCAVLLGGPGFTLGTLWLIEEYGKRP